MSDFSPKNATDFSSQIFSFRTAYLRAVAKASMDLKFREDIISKRGEPPKNVLPILRTQFGYSGTWNLSLVIRDDPRRAPRLDPVKGITVARPYLTESITVFIPDRPKDVGVEEQMKRLAVLYQDINDWLLGVHQPAVITPVSPDRPDRELDADAAFSRPGRYDLGDTVTQFTSFVAALFNAVALAWTNARFMQLLTNPDPSPREAQPGATVALLRDWLGYSYPWDLDLHVRTAPYAEYFEAPPPGSKDKPANKKYPRWEITPPTLSLTLPWMTGALDAKDEVKANLQNPGVAMMGLALYNTDGAGYPFTCG